MPLLRTVADTIAWGHSLAQSLRAGDVIALTGGLGAGKTHAVKGIAAGLGSGADVTSPTFTLAHEYAGGRLPLYHFDFYRIKTPDEVLAIGWDEYLDAAGVIAVEWADKFPEVIPPGAKWFRFTVLDDAARGVEEIGLTDPERRETRSRTK